MSLIFRVLLAGLLIPAAALGQSDTQQPGTYTDGPGLPFFDALRFGAFDYRPTTFEEIVERSSVIARGNISGVIPGRSVGSYASPAGSVMNTVFVRIVPSRIMKGQHEDYYLVEIMAPMGRVNELAANLYTDDVIFMLLPASNLLTDPKISVSSEAEAEWQSGKSLYALSMRSTLFTISGADRLSSPLDVYRAFEDIYTEIATLEELESHIVGVRASRPTPDEAAVGGSRNWYTNPEDAPRGLVREHHENGQLKSEIHYYEGVMDGPAQAWYDNGQLQAESIFADGELDGPSRYWHQNGQLALHSTYREGQRVECEAWTEDGSPTDCP